MSALAKETHGRGREYLYNEISNVKDETVQKPAESVQNETNIHHFKRFSFFMRVAQKLELHPIHQSCIESDRRFLVRQPSESVLVTYYY